MHPPGVTLDVSTLQQAVTGTMNTDEYQEQKTISWWKYGPLIIAQIILIILFYIFVDYRSGALVRIDGFEGTHVMIFIGFGYLMTFLRRYGYSATGLNFLLASFAIQWAIICNFYETTNGKIVIDKTSILEADVMSATVLITMGALLGVASGVQLLFLSVVEVFIGCLNLHFLESKLKAADVGGSIAIHAYGAYFGLSASFVMNMFRKDKVTVGDSSEINNLNGPSYISDITAMIGTLFLWIYWPSFNSALADLDSKAHERCILNTYLSLCACTVVAFAVSSLVNEHKKGAFDMVHIQNSTLAGGVAIGSVSNMYVSPGGALLIGSIAGALSVLGYRYLTPKLDKIGIKDTCGVNNLHGMPGILSGIISIIYAAMATSNQYGAEYEDVFKSVSNSTSVSGGALAVQQAYALLMTLGFACIAGAVAGFVSLYLPKISERKRLYNDDNDWEVPPPSVNHGI